MRGAHNRGTKKKARGETLILHYLCVTGVYEVVCIPPFTPSVTEFKVGFRSKRHLSFHAPSSPQGLSLFHSFHLQSGSVFCTPVVPSLFILY